jgi:hypothetical protein
MIGPDDDKGAYLRGIDEVENVIELLWCAASLTPSILRNRLGSAAQIAVGFAEGLAKNFRRVTSQCYPLPDTPVGDHSAPRGYS